MKYFIFLFSFVVSALGSFSAFSQQNYQENHQQNYQQELQESNKVLSEAELAQMLAPIALYPDSLLTHILISSTYPIEIVEAHRWLKKNGKLNAEQISQRVEKFKWDASVKALVPFERILSRLSEDLSWMQQLGDAFLQDETRVLDSIQALRKQARLAGNLDKMENMDISYKNNNIHIEPVVKEVVYVPYYDTRMVYGSWHWASYPPVYWSPSHRIYVNNHRPFYWHSGIHISFNYFFSSFHWHKRHVVVINPHRTHRYSARRLVASEGYAKRWSHKPVHRRGVAYRNKHTSNKYYTNKRSGHKSKKNLEYVKHNFKQRLSTNNHFSNKSKANKEPVRQNNNVRKATKQHSASVKYKDSKQNKGLNHRTHVKKVPSKKHQGISKERRSKHVNRKQRQQRTSVQKQNKSRKYARN